MQVLLSDGPTVIVCIEIVVGMYLAALPHRALNLQQGIYQKLNWKLKPNPREKEVRDLRMIGIMLLIAGVTALICIINMEYLIKSMIWG